MAYFVYVSILKVPGHSVVILVDSGSFASFISQNFGCMIAAYAGQNF